MTPLSHDRIVLQHKLCLSRADHKAYHDNKSSHACLLLLLLLLLLLTRWGYRDVGTLGDVVANYSAAALPLETLWSDIEYMPTRFWTMEMDPCESSGLCQWGW
jgi:hypothetical protein